jgi:hypothetical protein
MYVRSGKGEKVRGRLGDGRLRDGEMDVKVEVEIEVEVKIEVEAEV